MAVLGATVFRDVRGDRARERHADGRQPILGDAEPTHNESGRGR